MTNSNLAAQRGLEPAVPPPFDTGRNNGGRPCYRKGRAISVVYRRGGRVEFGSNGRSSGSWQLEAIGLHTAICGHTGKDGERRGAVTTNEVYEGGFDIESL